MSIKEQTWQVERQRLENVEEIIRKKLQEQGDERQNFRNDVIAIQKSMWEEVNPTPTDLDDLANVWQTQVDIDRRGRNLRFVGAQIRKLERMLLSPYFGRIDFRENQEDAAEKIYIGISNLMDEGTAQYLIYDWRAPISSLFYDYETGEAAYKCPGGIIEGKMSLKRQYKVVKGILELMFDCSIKIDDEILQEILSKSTDSKMKTIITSIQREQNKVIRDDTHKILVVQGPAGSGKTSIALHRIAFLLYRYRDTIQAENIVIFSPNQIFSDYISNVLPELGEENMRRTTFMEYAQHTLKEFVSCESESRFMEYLLTERGNPGFYERIDSIQFKTSQDFINVLRKYAAWIGQEGPSFSDITYKGIVIAAKEAISTLYKKDYAYLPVCKRLQKIRQRLFYLLEPYEKQRLEQVMQEVAETAGYIDGGEIKVKSLYLVKEEFQSVKVDIERMTELGLLECYQQLFMDRKLFDGLVGDKIPENVDEIIRVTLDSFKLQHVSYEDVAPLLFLQGELEGIPSTAGIKHVVIDEVQDYTPVQFEVLKQLFSNCRLTLLGDLNQSINPYANIGDYSTITDVFNSKQLQQINLTKSYRSTRQIAEFTNQLLRKNMQTDSMDRIGDKPLISRVENMEDLCHTIKSIVPQLRYKGYKSIAMICKTAETSKFVFERLKSEMMLNLISCEDKEFTTGVVVVPSYLSKGLEFDAVLVLCTFDERYDHGEERRLLYTVCTRALHQLRIYYMGHKPEFLADIENTMYHDV